MKKRTIAAIIIILLLVLGGMYWLGYIQFHDNFPTFVPNPGTSKTNSPPTQTEVPQLAIGNIRGRINKVSADITNIGTNEAKHINWTISVKGGILKRIDVHSSGSVAILAVDSGTTVMTERIPIGLGRLEITVTAESAGGQQVTQTAKGFKLFFFVIGVRS